MRPRRQVRDAAGRPLIAVTIQLKPTAPCPDCGRPSWLAAVTGDPCIRCTGSTDERPAA
jgi:hypothetical protein